MKGKIIDLKFNAAERKAMDAEIRKQLAEYDAQHTLELESMILWYLHAEFGFGKKRLRRFYEGFTPMMKDLVRAYGMADKDRPQICMEKLKEIGVDINEWHDEKEDAVYGGEQI